MKILALNPGSTSTKVSLFNNLEELFTTKIFHTSNDLEKYKSILSQYDMRKDTILKLLKEKKVELKDIDVIISRGGVLKPIEGGVYRVNEEIINDMMHPVIEHASCLGGVIAYELFKAIGKETETYISDPVTTDEMNILAKFTGLPSISRMSAFHVLNHKSIARKYADSVNKKYEDLNLIVVHMGGGISIGVHHNGKVIDVTNAATEGPFSPERAGALPTTFLLKLAAKIDNNKKIQEMLMGQGGLVAYLGTNDTEKIIKNINNGDEKSKILIEAMCYQIAKDIGAMSTVVNGEIDQIILTGGIAYSDYICELIKKRVAFIADVKIFPGENEMQALAENIYRVKSGKEFLKKY